ncbi:cell wall hydrolase [Anaerobacillus alkaliphilus]|uniref:Cell wall hydrolase n=1 Tax=Anaerobacillus alkaliphilus TaxID=1548597 RepID=A0A4Q0VMJ1_9BACI|nr:cell wall hydrolase [Anaerobacillus alkaliphilus]RXI96617.1 cell wall hydrolase [Anaerobacillus alkaliphilus]
MGRRINHNERDVEHLARLMLAEAIGEGPEGMDLVGTVVANRVEADCDPDFRNLRTINHVIYQTIPGTGIPHFEPVLNGSLYTQRPDEEDLQRARDLLHGHRNPRARQSLWFFNPSPGKAFRDPCTPTMPRSPMTQFAFAYKNHCFYVAVPGYCPEFYR